MQNQVITVAKKKYATGLLWQPVAASYTARNYAKHLINTVHRKLNFFTEFKGMVGLGYSKYKHRSGMQSAAAEVMYSLADYSSFLAVFRTGNKFYLIATRNAIILKDEVYDSEYLAKEEYMNLVKIPDWNALFAPATWNMPKSVEKNIDDVITGNAKVFIKPISLFKTNFISLILVGGFIYAGYNFFKDPIMDMISYTPQVVKINPELAESFKRKAEQSKKLQEELTKKIIKPEEIIQPIEMPYDNLPNPTAAADLCYKATAYLMQPIVGWDQSDVICEGKYVTVNFNRDFGTLDSFYQIANSLMPGAFVQELSDSDILVRAALPQLETFASLDERDQITIGRQVMSIFQELDINAIVNNAVVTVGSQLQNKEVNTVEISSTNKLSPPEFINIFDGFDGVFLNRTEWEPRNKNWNYEVIIYAK